MSARTRIVERWRTRLAESQRRVDGCPVHRRWIHQIYARIYRFLISCYGVGEWRSDADADRDGEADASRMEFVDNTEGEQGTRPKSAERIRATLDAVRDAMENPSKPGQLSGGLQFTDWVAVASESSRVSPSRLVRLLRLNDIEARQVRRGDDVIVEVFAGRREDAMKLLESHRPSLVIQRRNRRGIVPIITTSRQMGVFDHIIGHACFGGFVGAIIGALPMLLLALVLDAVYSPRSSSSGDTIVTAVLSIGWGAFAAIGAVVSVFRYCKSGH